MAAKKLPKDIDLTEKINPADGFFSQSIAPKEKRRDLGNEKINMSADSKEYVTNRSPGGRPRKEGLKNEQFTLTMDPELYEKLRIIAKDQTYGNVSALINMAVRTYCRVNSIDLTEIKVDPADLEVYKKKQEKKRNRKK